jgi:uncharacterized phiE125 gp8 family phage protein
MSTTLWYAYKLAEPEAEPVSVEEGVRHMRLQYADSDERAHVASVLEAARQLVEDELRRQLITASWRLQLAGFPERDGSIVLPRPPAQNVSGVDWQDHTGAWHHVYGVEFRISNGVGRVFPPVTGQETGWPSAITRGVRVDFTAGYGDEAADVPMPIRQAILLWASTFYEQPDAQTDKPLIENKAADRLLAPYRIGDAP